MKINASKLSRVTGLLFMLIAAFSYNDFENMVISILLAIYLTVNALDFSYADKKGWTIK